MKDSFELYKSFVFVVGIELFLIKSSKIAGLNLVSLNEGLV